MAVGHGARLRGECVAELIEVTGGEELGPRTLQAEAALRCYFQGELQRRRRRSCRRPEALLLRRGVGRWRIGGHAAVAGGAAASAAGGYGLEGNPHAGDEEPLVRRRVWARYVDGDVAVSAEQRPVLQAEEVPRPLLQIRWKKRPLSASSSSSACHGGGAKQIKRRNFLHLLGLDLPLLNPPAPNPNTTKYVDLPLPL